MANLIHISGSNRVVNASTLKVLVFATVIHAFNFVSKNGLVPDAELPTLEEDATEQDLLAVNERRPLAKNEAQSTVNAEGQAEPDVGSTVPAPLNSSDEDKATNDNSTVPILKIVRRREKLSLAESSVKTTTPTPIKK